MTIEKKIEATNDARALEIKILWAVVGFSFTGLIFAGSTCFWVGTQVATFSTKQDMMITAQDEMKKNAQKAHDDLAAQTKEVDNRLANHEKNDRVLNKQDIIDLCPISKN